MKSFFKHELTQSLLFVMVIIIALIVSILFYKTGNATSSLDSIKKFIPKSEVNATQVSHILGEISEINITKISKVLEKVSELNNTKFYNILNRVSCLKEEEIRGKLEQNSELNATEILQTLKKVSELNNFEPSNTLETISILNKIEILDRAVIVSKAGVLKTSEVLKRYGYDYFLHKKDALFFAITLLTYFLIYVLFKIYQKYRKKNISISSQAIEFLEELEEILKDYDKRESTKGILKAQRAGAEEEGADLIEDKKNLLLKLIKRMKTTHGFKLKYPIYKVSIPKLLTVHEAYYQTYLELKKQNEIEGLFDIINNEELKKIIEKLVEQLDKQTVSIEAEIKERTVIVNEKMKDILAKYTKDKKYKDKTEDYEKSLYYSEFVSTNIFCPPLTTLRKLKKTFLEIETIVLESKENSSTQIEDSIYIKTVIKNLEYQIKLQDGSNNKYKESYKDIFTLYDALIKEKEFYINSFYNKYCLRVRKLKKLKWSDSSENLTLMDFQYHLLEYCKENIKTRTIRHNLRDIKFSMALEKGNKQKWKQVTEIIEHKAHHILLADFKTHDLRVRPYSIETMVPDFKDIIKENKILTIYYKIYNIVNPLKNKKIDGQAYEVKNDLIVFLETNIKELHEHKINTVMTLVGNFLGLYFIYILANLFAFIGISLAIYPEVTIANISSFNINITEVELFYFNFLILISFFTILSFILLYYLIKKWTLNNFILYKSLLVDYINNIALVFIIFGGLVAALAWIDSSLIDAKEHFHFYKEIGNMFTHLLFPSGFDSVIYAMKYENIELSEFKIFMEYSATGLSPFKLLVYKFIFLSILAYLVFTIVNFIIKKYDAIYFNDQRKTLIPPELATIAINFLLGIFFLILFYGTTIKYLNFDLNKHKEKIIKIEKAYLSNTDKSISEPMALASEGDTQGIVDYIPFSIFIALIGGLLTMATRDLLENYFAGLSLQMDAPYEEHDRITINDSEMYEVHNIGIRADRFYGIESNAMIVIPHKKLIGESIVNYTLPTLDYRHELTIYIPHHTDTKNTIDRSIPKRAEMLLMLAIYVNTGVKLPTLELGKDDTSDNNYGEKLVKLDLESELKEFKKFIQNFSIYKEENKEEELEKRVVNKKIYALIDKLSKFDENKLIKLREKNEQADNLSVVESKVLEELEELNNKKDNKSLKKLLNLKNRDQLISEEDYEDKLDDKIIEDIWKKLVILEENYDTSNSIRHPLTQLFMFKLVSSVREAERDGDQKSEKEEEKVIKKIKATVASIILALERFQTLADEELHHHIDKNFVLRKYKMFRGDDKPESDKLRALAKELVHVNYYYFSLANSLWKLKDLQESLFRKREIDSTSLELLDVPRVSAEQIYSGEGNLNYWKVTANITLELGEQSNEIIHHISMYIDSLWDDFELPKYYKIEEKKNNINIDGDGLKKLIFSYKKNND